VFEIKGNRLADMEPARKDPSVLPPSYEDEEILTVALDIFKPHIEGIPSSQYTRIAYNYINSTS
jgi:hypothetical protein